MARHMKSKPKSRVRSSKVAARTRSSKVAVRGSSAGCAPGFSVLPESTGDGKVFRILLHGKRIPSVGDPRGKYALTHERAVELTHSLNPKTGKRYRPWDK